MPQPAAPIAHLRGGLDHVGSSTLEFWFEFASPYSYIAASRIESLCNEAQVPFSWKAFALGPVFELQGWNTSPFVLNPLRGKYMWRDMERLTAKYGLPWCRPSTFPSKSVLAARVAAACTDQPWIGSFVRAAFAANFGEQADLNEWNVVSALIASTGGDPVATLLVAIEGSGKSALRQNTEKAISLGMFGAPNCLVGDELFWGEETLEDAIAWAHAEKNLNNDPE
ncbi:MAG: 2-hydroxychromene-2-carboxylate isomerase [Candidatus Cybelea sp.]